MKKLKFSLLIVISILSLTAASFAADTDNPTKQTPTQIDVEKYLLNLLSSPSIENIINDVHYNEFVSSLKFKSNSSLQTTRIIKLASEKLAALYKAELNTSSQGMILMALDRLSQNALTYSIKSQNRLLQNYLLKVVSYVGEETYQRVANIDTTKTGYVPNKEKQIDVFREKIDLYVKKIKDGTQSTPEVLKLRETKIEISFRELKSQSSENISFIIPKGSREKVFTFKIVEPSVDSAEAALVATKALLAHEYVKGVYFDDLVRIPSKIARNSYEMSFMGANVLLKRPSCSKLFQ